MTDAELIYNACLRVERKFELPEGTHELTPKIMRQVAIYEAAKAIREEIGRGIAETHPS